MDKNVFIRACKLRQEIASYKKKIEDIKNYKLKVSDKNNNCQLDLANALVEIQTVILRLEKEFDEL